MENHENLIGKILGGRYKIQAIVGEGGMSVVMRAYDAIKMCDVTIKLLSYKNSTDQNAVERFTNEAKAVALLSHPNIVSVYDVSLEGTSKYIVMEYINGITLKEYLDRKVRLDWPEAVHYINQVLAALSHAHEKGIIHRDIKPENVMLMRNGSIKVIDFGIAKLPDSKSLTVTDKAIGTVNYISPEQASGHGSTEKSDIYSTGIMLYELVTGQLPFVSASSVSVAMMHVSSEPAMPSSICDSLPMGLEQIIIKAMMKDPERRFGSAIAMKKALEYLSAHPATIFNEKNSIGPDGKPILSTGATQNNGNNTVITGEISPEGADKSVINGGGRKMYNEYDDSDAGDEEDDEYSYVKPSRSSMLPIILGVTSAFFTVLLLFAILIFGNLNNESSTGNDKTILTVPNLVGMEFTEEMYNNLTSQGYNVNVKQVPNDRVESGYIIYQTPLAESTRMYTEKGVDITLEVSEGTSEIILKDYKHYQASGVKLSLEALGLKVQIKREFNDIVIADHIIRTSPENGASIFEGDTVTLYVSKGPEDMLVEIPESILGLTYRRAESLLQDLGIKVDEERGSEYSDEYEADRVMGTEPAIGTSVSINNDKVKIIISKGSEPDAEAFPTMGYDGINDGSYNPYYGTSGEQSIPENTENTQPSPAIPEENTGNGENAETTESTEATESTESLEDGESDSETVDEWQASAE